jgi:Cu(I)/Ag(I) efflux system membrane protein CusA/SilA
MPALEDVTWVAQNVAGHLRNLDLIRPGADALRFQADPLSEGAFALHTILGGSPPTFFSQLHRTVLARHQVLWRQHVQALDSQLQERGPILFTRLALESLLNRMTVTDARVRTRLAAWERARSQPPAASPSRTGHHHGLPPGTPPPSIDPIPELDTLEKESAQDFGRWVWLVRVERAELAGFGGELDRVMQMPGWTNVWTMPIQNRVDMLATGVNTTVGVRVLGRRLEDVASAADAVAATVKRVSGAADVVADPVRGKGYLEVRVDRERALRHGVSVGDVNDLVETALGGKVVATTVEGRERHPVCVRFGRSWREDEESVRNLPVPVGVTTTGPPAGHVALAEVADVRIVEGPATIKSENGLLRSYVRLNVRGRDAVEFVEEASRAVAEQGLPEGTFVEWTGQFLNEERAQATLLVIVPVVVLVIFLVLWWTYRDLGDALLMLLAVPGAVAGGVFCQWLFGYMFSVTVWVGYIACFGMATATGIIMLVYLREAVEKAGGLANVTLEQLRQAVLDGAVHRLRPKLLTEATTVLGLAPLLWATGVGADVIRPMVLPVLGGLLVADEVIDLFLPVLFYHVRRRRWERLHGPSQLGPPSRIA